MKNNVMLSVTSLLSIILFLLHVADDIVRGIEPGTMANVGTIPILLVWLYGTLVLTDRRWGQVIMLLGALLALVVPILHLRGAGVGGDFAKSSGALLFIWTIFALGATGSFSAVLAVRALLKR